MKRHNDIKHAEMMSYSANANRLQGKSAASTKQFGELRDLLRDSSATRSDLFRAIKRGKEEAEESGPQRDLPGRRKTGRDSEFVSGGQLGRGDSIWFRGEAWKVTRVVSGIDALVIYGKPDEGGVEQRLFKRLHSRDTKAIKRMSRGSARAANDPNGRRARFRAWHKKAMAEKKEDLHDVTHNVRVTARAVAKGELPSLYDMRTVRTPIGGFRLGRDAEALRGMSLQTLGRLLIKAIRAGREDVALLLEKEIDRRAKGGR